MSPPGTAGGSLALDRGGSGPPLVLVHGLGLDRRCWSPVREALEQHHDVVAVDLPGFGESRGLAKGDTPTPARLADVLEHEIDRLGFAAPAVVGNSLGGWVALELARRGRASCVVAIAPSGLENPAERGYVIALNEVMRVRARLSTPFARQLSSSRVARTVLFGGLRSRPWRVPAPEGEGDLHEFGRSRGFQAALRAGVGGRVTAGLSGITVPVRIAYGTFDFMLGALTAPRFAAAIPGAELIPLPRLGHVPMLDDPDLVARTILDFTTRVRTRRGLSDGRIPRCHSAFRAAYSRVPPTPSASGGERMGTEHESCCARAPLTLSILPARHGKRGGRCQLDQGRRESLCAGRSTALCPDSTTLIPTKAPTRDPGTRAG